MDYSPQVSASHRQRSRPISEQTRECHAPRTDAEPNPSCKLRTRRGSSLRAPGLVRRLQRPLETNASWGRFWDTRRAERWRGGRGRSGSGVSGVCEWLSLMFPEFGIAWRDTSSTLRQRSSCTRQAERGHVLGTIDASRQVTTSASCAGLYELPGFQIGRDSVS